MLSSSPALVCKQQQFNCIHSPQRHISATVCWPSDDTAAWGHVAQDSTGHIKCACEKLHYLRDHMIAWWCNAWSLVSPTWPCWGTGLQGAVDLHPGCFELERNSAVHLDVSVVEVQSPTVLLSSRIRLKLLCCCLVGKIVNFHQGFNLFCLHEQF